MSRGAAHRADPSAPHRSMPRRRPTPTPSRENSFDAAGHDHNPRDSVASPERLRDFALHLSLTQERERLRIAVGLHDQVGQNLALLKGKLEALQTSEDSPQNTRSIAEMCALVAQTIEATRTLTFDLASPLLHQLGLEAALRGLGERLQRRHGVRFRLEAGEPRKPSPEATKVIVYRCVRELLRNIADHAQARHATMRITESRGQLAVAVEDDGVGFDPSGLEGSFSPSGRFGLYSIAEQLRLIGGRLEIDSAPGGGTRAVVVVPVEPGAEQADCRRDAVVAPGSETTQGGQS